MFEVVVQYEIDVFLCKEELVGECVLVDDVEYVLVDDVENEIEEV